MAVLSDNDRLAVWEQWMRENKETITGALTKAELRAVVDAADTWANDNAAAYNLALPQPGRGVLSTPQKVAILMYVVAKRYGTGV
jgi:hypothetical protein